MRLSKHTQKQHLKLDKMADKKDNVYQVKLKLIPDKIGYKSSFVSGIVLAKTQELAILVCY